MKDSKRDLRFTGDACEQLLVPWDAGAAGRRPETHRPELNRHGAVDHAIHCQRATDNKGKVMV